MQTGFDSFGLPPKLLHALTRIKFTEPTPIQTQTIPLALEGRDILGSAQTGTGKTGAFGIPVIAGLMNNLGATALIMTPTRELAGQVLAALQPMIPTNDVGTALLIGGEAMPRQLSQLRGRPRLIVGTPGRINDHLERKSLDLSNVRYLVLDETDRMLDMGFGIQIERILRHVPAERQTLLFSATLPSNIGKLSGKYMRDPARIAVGSSVAPVAKIKQEVIPVTDADKYGKLLEQLDARKGSIIIFVKTKYGTEKLAKKLNGDQQRADVIHGDLQQRRRDRVIQSFRDKRFRILVATDVAARGLDIPHIEHVINYDMPQAPEDYIHRIGRTARAGAEGEAVSFLTSADNQKWRAIQRLMGGEDPNMPAPRGGKGGPRKSGGFGGKKPFWKRDGDKPYGDKPRGERPHSDRPHSDRPRSDRPHSDRPHAEAATGEAAARSERVYTPRPHSDRPHSDRPRSDRPHSDRPREDRPREDRPRGARPFNRSSRPPEAGSFNPLGEERAQRDRPHSERLHSDRPHSDRPHSERPHSDRPRSDRPHSERSREDRPFGDKPRGERPHSDRPHSDRPRSDRPHSDRPREDRPHSDRPHSDKPRSDKPREERGDKPFGKRKPFGKPHGKSFSGGKKFDGPRVPKKATKD